MKRSRGEDNSPKQLESDASIHNSSAPSSAMQIHAESMQDLHRWLVRNWSEGDGRISKDLFAIERLWDLGQPVRLQKKDEKLGWKELEIVPLTSPTLALNDAKGKKTFCAMIRDVTHARSELENLTDFFDNGGLCLHWVGPDGTILRANRRELEFLGYSPDEYIGRNITEFHADQDAVNDILARLRRGERVVDYSARLRCKDGSLRNVLIDSSVLFSETGEFVHTRCFTRDVTLQKKMEQDLVRAKDEAENANKAKDIFLAVLSHELRTPLTPVVMTVPVLSQDPRLPDDAKEQLEMVAKNLEVEVRLIDDLLDLTAVSRGRVQLSKTEVDMHNLVWQTVQLLSAEMDQKLLQTSFLLRSIKNRKLVGDPLRLQQVLRNVLRNAIKYTPTGGMITIKSKDSDTNDDFEIEITDSGEGIDPAILPTVFEAFQQGDRAHGGLGLGLAIARAIVALHGGSITASSAGIGSGTTISIRLPPTSSSPSALSPSAAGFVHSPKSHSPTPVPLSPRKILLIEDDPSTRMALSRLLETKLHHCVHVAATGNEALALFASNQYHLIISDIGLPDYTGHDLLPKFLALRPQQKAIALSGYGMPQDIQKSLSVGFAKHLTKPITISLLQEAINEVLG